VINGITLGLIGPNIHKSMSDAESRKVVTGMEDSERCDRSWMEWDLDNSVTLTSEFATYLKTQVFATLEPVGEGSLYSECDGITRFKFLSSPTSTRIGTVTVIRTQTVWKTTSKSISTNANLLGRPTCYPALDYCTSKNNQFIRDLMKSADVMPAHPTSMRPFEMACQAPPFDQESNCDLWSDSEVMLFYWPPHLTSRDICANNGYGTAVTISQNFASIPTHVTSAITFEGQDLYLLKEEPMTNWCTYGCIQTVLGKDDGPDGRYNCAGGCLNETSSDFPTPTIKSIGPMTLTGPFTFTYPTVYLAHQAISRTEYRSYGPGFGVGPVIIGMIPATVVRNAGVIPLRQDDVYSEIRTFRNEIGGLDYAQKVARGQFQPIFVPNDVQDHKDENGTVYLPYSVQSFDFGQLKDPVPASVYYNARFEDCWGSQSHCETITAGNYRPRLALKNRVWFSLMSEHFSCNMRILNDPPRDISEIPLTTLPTASIRIVETARPGGIVDPPLITSTTAPNQGAESPGSYQNSPNIDQPEENTSRPLPDPNNTHDSPTKTKSPLWQLTGLNPVIWGNLPLPTKTAPRSVRPAPGDYNPKDEGGEPADPQDLVNSSNILPDVTGSGPKDVRSSDRLKNSGNPTFGINPVFFSWILCIFILNTFTGW
jgi:hypothetical protein